jgi:hypothetical protein
MADQNRRSIVFAADRSVEDFIFSIDISLLLFFTSEVRSSPDFAIGPFFSYCESPAMTFTG